MQERSKNRWLGVLGTVNAWLGVLGMPSKAKGVMESYGFVLEWAEQPIARAAFLVASVALFAWLYHRTIGAVTSPARAWLDFAYCKTLRRFPFVGVGIANGWKAAPETANVSVQTISTKDSCLDQVEADQIRASGSTGICFTFDDPAPARLVEFIVRPGQDSRLEVQVCMKVHGQSGRKYGGFVMGLEDIATPVSTPGSDWKVPNLQRTLCDGWVSLVCDVQKCFAKSHGKEGHELEGIKRLIVIGERTDLAEVRLRGRRF